MTARFVVAYTDNADNGLHVECGNHPDREPAQTHADHLNTVDPQASAAVIEYPS